MVRKSITQLIEKAIKSLQKEGDFIKFEIPKISLELQEIEQYGDYSSNISLQISKIARKNPKDVAEIIKGKLSKEKMFGKIEIAGPGFLNFFLSKECLQKEVEEILEKKEKFGDLTLGKEKKASVEFICANPTGELHIGHGRGAFFGDALSSVFKKAGYKVEKEHYTNDAKASSQIKELGRTALGQGNTYLNDYLEKKINGLKAKIEKCRNEGEAGNLLAREVQKDIKNFIENELKIKFDNWISEEKDLYKTGKIEKVYDWLEKKNLIYQKDGAKWLKTSEYGDKKDWVIVRETGEFTYLLPDIAYHKIRFDKDFDRIVDIWGADHQGHVGKIRAVAKILGYKGRLDFLISQVVRLKGEKISKRKGKTITLNWLVKEAGPDAVRFMYLMKSLDTQMEFDLGLALEKSSKSPVYYVQYAYARICSIFKKTNIKPKSKELELLNHPSELKLAKHLIKFPEIVEDISNNYQIQRLPQYTIELATSFHQFYQQCRVVSEDKKLTSCRLGLVLAAKIVLKEVLSIMRVSAPEKM
ncbi:MAG: arginine--tRNA ligase [Candidatus Nealsonbacteria bacterium]